MSEVVNGVWYGDCGCGRNEWCEHCDPLRRPVPVSHSIEATNRPVDVSRELIIRLCEQHGFGYVMQIAADEWRQRDPIGALTVGPCVGMPEKMQ